MSVRTLGLGLKPGTGQYPNLWRAPQDELGRVGRVVPV